MENISPILAADQEAMAKHLEMLFGRAMSGRIEITAIRAAPKDEKHSPRTHFFALDAMEDAVAWAASVNAEPGWNVYVGAALRREDVFPGKAADDDDFLEAWAMWADCDEEEQVVKAKAIYEELHIKPPFIVVTGRTPGRRAQLWWPLDEPIKDPQVLRITARGIADTLGTDHGVLTAKQLMRLAGGVSWPKPNKPGRVLELTELVLPTTTDYEFNIERLHRAFPPAERKALAELTSTDTTTPSSMAGALAQPDLRSALAFMSADDRDLWVRMGHALKGLGQQGRGLWLEWSQTSPKYDPGDAARVWDSFHPDRTDYRAVFAEAQRQGWVNPAKGSAPVATRESVDPTTGEVTEVEDLFEVLSIADLKAMPDAQWLIDKAIPRQSLGFIYGAPGTYKSFLCYDLALALAYGHPTWLDREIKAPGSVLYITSEGVSSAKNRITAWQMKQAVETDSSRFRLIRKSMSFLDKSDVDRLERTVAHEVAANGPVDLVFVDTVSRVLPGADENLQKDMTLFVAACDRLRERFSATVIGVHHTNKNGDMRGSTVFLGQGDCVFRVDRDDGRKSGILSCEKQKDAEDGWKVAYTVETQAWIPAGHIVEVSSLTVTFGGEPEAEDTDAWPSRETCRDILKTIDEAWTKCRPWSPHPRAQAEGHYAVANICRDFGLKPGTVKDMLEAWQKNEIVVFEEFDKHSKRRGLKVLQWLD